MLAYSYSQISVMGAGRRFWCHCSHHLAALLSLTLSLCFFSFSSSCPLIAVSQGGAQVVWMDRISVLDHKHVVPSAHCGALQPIPLHSPVSPAQTWRTESNSKDSGRDSSHWRNKIFVSYNHFGNMTLPPTRRQRQPTEHSEAPGWT